MGVLLTMFSARRACRKRGVAATCEADRTFGFSAIEHDIPRTPCRSEGPHQHAQKAFSELWFSSFGLPWFVGRRPGLPSMRRALCRRIIRTGEVFSARPALPAPTFAEIPD